MEEDPDLKRPLSPMAQRFAEEFIKDSSSSKKAAIRAGYSIDTAAQIGSRLLQDKRVRKLIKDSQKKGAEICGITAARVLQELALIAFAKPGDVVSVNSEGEAEVDLNGLSRDKAAGSEVQVNLLDSGGRKSKSVSVKTVKPADKVAALTQIGKHLGMFKEQVEVNHTTTLKDLIDASFKDEPLDMPDPGPAVKETIN